MSNSTSIPEQETNVHGPRQRRWVWQFWYPRGSASAEKPVVDPLPGQENGEPQTPPQRPVTADDAYRKLYAVKLDEIQNSAALYEKIQKYRRELESMFREIGIADGKLNIYNEQIKPFARVEAIHLAGEVNYAIDQFFVPAEHDKKILEDKKKALEREISRLQAENRVINCESNRKPKHFSTFRLRMYLLAGFGLMAFDLPLFYSAALSLMNIRDNEGFDWGQLKYYLPILLTLGIACFPIFIKFFVDKYILINSLPASPATDPVHESNWWQQIRSAVRRNIPSWIEFLFLLLVLASVVLTLLNTGIFRLLKSKQNEKEEDYGDVKVDVNVNVNEEVVQFWGMEFSLTEITPVTYLLMTFMFSFLSGIFISYGLHLRTKIYRKKLIKESLADKVKLWEELGAEIKKAEEVLIPLQRLKTTWLYTKAANPDAATADTADTDTIIEQQQQMFASMYSTGFEQGINIQSSSKFETIRHAHLRNTAKRLSEELRNN